MNMFIMDVHYALWTDREKTLNSSYYLRQLPMYERIQKQEYSALWEEIDRWSIYNELKLHKANIQSVQQDYRNVSNISRTLVGNKIVDH